MARARLYLELSKARLCGLVVMTTAAGYLMAFDGSLSWARFLNTMLGTALAAFGANALNQVIERVPDARMHRTCHRPLPSGRLGVPEATAWGVGCCVAGVALLATAANILTAGLGAATILLYLLAYTPLKTRTPANTLVGSVVGAIPPLMGAAAANGRLDLGAWVLAAILFVWQIPHFLALAFLLRDDYARGGFRMLPTPALDPTGRITARLVLTYGLALLPVTLALTLTGLTGWFYSLGALALGLWLIFLAARMVWESGGGGGEESRLERVESRAEGTSGGTSGGGGARRVFLGSVVYLPLLLLLMTADRLVVMRLP
jgi:heme o synthase